MLRFLVQVEGTPDAAVDVRDDRVIAGSDPALPITLGEGAARRHFEVEVRPGVGVILRHLASDGETKVNGALVSQVRLQAGDVISVGRSRVVFTLYSEAAVAAPVPEPTGARPPSPPTPLLAEAATLGGGGPRGPRAARRRAAGAPMGILVLVLLAIGVGAAYLLIKSTKPQETRVALRDLPTVPAPAPLHSERAPDAGPVSPALTDNPAGFDPEPIESQPIQVEPFRVEPDPASRTPARPDEPIPEPARPADPVPPDPDAAEREARARALGEARARLRAFEETLPDRIAGYEFAGPLHDLVGILAPLPDGSGEAAAALGLRDDLLGAQRTVVRFREALSDGSGVKIDLGRGLEVVVTGTDEEGFEAKAGPAVMKKKWTEIAPATVHEVLAGGSPEAGTWMDLSSFASVYGLPELVEEDLRLAFRRDESLKGEIDAALARRRGMETPEGGFVLLDDRWVTPQEKGYIEQGLVEHEGRWMTPDEVLAAKGFVEHEGRWLSPEDYQEVLEAEREAEELAKKFLPKGLIDLPGNGKSVPWEDARDLKTQQYRIRSNLSPEVTKDIAYTMEILRTNLKRVFGLRGRGARFTVNVCANREEYHKIWPRSGMSLGFCSSGEICTFYQPPMTTSVLMHEGTHEMLRRFAPNCPGWLHEGMATYYECSQFEFDAKRRKVNLKVGLLNSHRLMSFRREQQMGLTVSLETFMQGKGGNPYTEGWAFVYYLAKGNDGQYARNLHSFIDEAHKSDVVERFQKIFKVKDLAEFEKDWLEFIGKLDPKDGVTLAKSHR